MYTVTVTDKTISVRGNGTQFAVILTPTKKLEIHRSIEGKNDKHAAAIQTNIRKVLSRQLSTKLAWKDRFKKVGTLLQEVSNAKTLHTMNNRFTAVVTEKYDM